MPIPVRVLCAVLLLVGLGCASADPVTSKPADQQAKPGQAVSSAPKQPTIVPVGQSIEVTETLFGQKSVTVYTISAPAQHARGANEYVKPQKGVFFVVTAGALVKEGKGSINPFYFKLVAADGTVHEQGFADFQPQLHHVELTAGQKASGLLMFDLPAAAIKGAKVELKSVTGDTAKGAWQLP